jgi:HEAT repeat protein
MAGFDGRTWLTVDGAARALTRGPGNPLRGSKGWLSESVAEPTGFVAAVTSWHADGRIRQRAARLLGDQGGPLRAAALAVRTLDFVPQVRDEAMRALLPHLGPDVAEPALGVLLAGRERQYGGAALAAVLRALQERMSLAELILRLLPSEQLIVRRWAYQTGHDHRLLSPEQLRAAVRSELDQLVRARCARWLAETGDPAALRELLTTRFVQARLDALTLISDDDLDTNTLLALMADRAPRVRETARWRAGRRGVGAADWYRRQLRSATGAPAFVAACLDGLASVGDASDVEMAKAALDDASPTVRTAAVTAVAALAQPEQAIGLLQPLLLDAAPRVCATAARALARAGAGPANATEAWGAGRASNRKAAWLLCRAGGGWERVEADLRAAADPDPSFASHGTLGIRTWLRAGAATTWAVLSDARRQRLEALLDATSLDNASRRAIAFHAGINQTTASSKSPPAEDGPAVRLLRLLRTDKIRRGNTP